MSTQPNTTKTAWYFAPGFIAPTLLISGLLIAGILYQNGGMEKRFTPIVYMGTVKELISDSIITKSDVRWYYNPSPNSFSGNVFLFGSFRISFPRDSNLSYKIVAAPAAGILKFGTEVLLLEAPKNISGYVFKVPAIDPLRSSDNHTLKLKIKSGTNPKVGGVVTLTLKTNPESITNATTDASGNVTFTNLERNNSYAITWNGHTLPFTTNNIPTTANIRGTFEW